MLLEQEAGIEAAQSALIVTQKHHCSDHDQSAERIHEVIWQIVSTDIDHSIAFINASISADPASLVCAHKLVVETVLKNELTL